VTDRCHWGVLPFSCLSCPEDHPYGRSKSHGSSIDQDFDDEEATHMDRIDPYEESLPLRQQTRRQQRRTVSRLERALYSGSREDLEDVDW